MSAAVEVFEQAMEWLRASYARHRFFFERDIVWTVQNSLNNEIQRRGSGYRVFNDFPMLPGSHRALSTDLAILSHDVDYPVEVAVEFKYEPSHRRKGQDIWHTKFPVVFWAEGVVKDTERIREFVRQGKARMAYAIFIDEGGYCLWRPRPEGSLWKRWEGAGPGGETVHVLWTRVISDSGVVEA